MNKKLSQNMMYIRTRSLNQRIKKKSMVRKRNKVFLTLIYSHKKKIILKLVSYFHTFYSVFVHLKTLGNYVTVSTFTMYAH